MEKYWQKMIEYLTRFICYCNFHFNGQRCKTTFHSATRKCLALASVAIRQTA